jgi:RNA polymerase sigma factor (sigma-70 family)
MPSRMQLMTDERLLSDYAATGSADTLSRIVDTHSNLVYSACLRVLGDPQTADDAAQAAFLAFVRKAKSLPGNTVLSSWLYFTAINCARVLKRAAARRAVHEREAALQMDHKQTDEIWQEIRPKVDAAIAALSPKYRDVLALRFFEGLSSDAAAERLGCPERTVRTRVARALATLRERLCGNRSAVSSVLLGSIIAQYSVQCAPSEFAKGITAACLGKAAASPAAAAAMNGALKHAAIAKAKTIAAALALTFSAATAATAGAIYMFHAAPATQATIAPKGPISIYPGDDIQKIVDANPEGTAFFIKSGVHRMQSVTPKPGDTFEGEKGAALNGSVVLSDFAREGRCWVAKNQKQRGQIHGEPEPDSPGAPFAEDLFFDDRPLKHVRKLEDVAPEKWFFDYDADKIYFADDPAGKRVETSVTRCAFAGQGERVAIRSLLIEKYACPAQMGVIGEQYPAKSWSVEDCEIRLNHGTGITLTGGWTVRRCNIHHNGQKGIGGDGSNVVIEDNEIAYNNYAHFSPGWEAGGSKFADTTGLLLKKNRVHHNRGPGLLIQTGNVDPICEGNSCYENLGPGIMLDRGYGGIVRNNVLTDNNRGISDWLWGSQLLIRSTSRVEVTENIVEASMEGGDGIGLIQQNMGAGKQGAYLLADINVHHNEITFRNAQNGASGLECDFNIDEVLRANLRFDFNRYHVPDLKTKHWTWCGGKDWQEFRALGREAHGFIDTNVRPAKSAAP